jgi:hypothetical protein
MEEHRKARGENAIKLHQEADINHDNNENNFFIEPILIDSRSKHICDMEEFIW